MKTAKLIQYKGGGYDGCYWEWNFCLLVDNEFHDVISSGMNAIKNKEELFEYIKSKDKYYKYDLNNKESLLEFTKETAEGTQGIVIKHVNTILNDDVMFFKCTYCESKNYVNKDHDDYPQYFYDPDNYSGNGGIGVNMHTILCEDCVCNTCEDCNSIFGPEDETYLLNERTVCEYCNEKEL